jgi:hypothetical protein
MGEQYESTNQRKTDLRKLQGYQTGRHYPHHLHEPEA